MSNQSPKIDLNILPDTYRRKRLTPKQAALFLALATAIALVFVLYQVTMGAMADTSNMQDDLDALDRQIELKKAAIAKKTGMQNIIREYDAIGDEQEIIINDLDYIIDLAGETITITSIAHGSENVTIVCEEDFDGWTEYMALIGVFDSYCTSLAAYEDFATVEHDLEDTYPPPSSPVDVKVTIEIVDDTAAATDTSTTE